MEHWRRTSSMEPLPLGRRQKKRDLEEIDGDDQSPSITTKRQKIEKLFPVVQVPHGNFMRPIDAAKCTDQGMIDTKVSKIQVDHIDSPKFLRNMIFSLQNGILAAKVDHQQRISSLQDNPSPEMQKSTVTKSRVKPHVSGTNKENATQKFGKSFTPSKSIPPGLRRPSIANISDQEEKQWYQNNTQIMARKKVKEILCHFRYLCEHLLKMERRADLAAAKIIKKTFCYLDKVFTGSVPGVEIGDHFHYRMEIHVLGLHRPPQGGIDWMFDGRRNIAISIVASGGYDNHMSNQETLIYSGQGGKECGSGNQGLAEDQKLKKGNLALMNSIKAKNPVRVIWGSKGCRNSTTYFYDGLYTVEKMWEDRGMRGKRIFKFKLVKIPGQVSLLTRRNGRILCNAVEDVER